MESVKSFLMDIYFVFLFLQSQQEEDAECVEPVDLGHVDHVHAVGAVRIPHLLR